MIVLLFCPLPAVSVVLREHDHGSLDASVENLSLSILDYGPDQLSYDPGNNLFHFQTRPGNPFPELSKLGSDPLLFLPEHVPHIEFLLPMCHPRGLVINLSTLALHGDPHLTAEFPI